MRNVVFALVLSSLSLSALPVPAVAQSATVDPPSKQDVLEWLEARPGQTIYNYGCSRVDHRTFICDFDLPPGSQIPHVSIQAVWVGSGWSYSFRQ